MRRLFTGLRAVLSVAGPLPLAHAAIAETHHVAITDNEFTPQTLVIAPGDTVIWTNNGSDHTVTADDSSFHETLEITHTFARTFESVGRYPYYCGLHGSPGADMFGVIRVLIPGEPNGLPSTPANTTPANGATNVSLAPTLTASAFSDPDPGDTHAASQWLLRVQGEIAPIFDSGVEVNHKVSLELENLTNGLTYEWQVRYKDDRGGWSEYSTPTAFTTVAPIAGGGTGLKATYGAFNARKQAVTKITAEQVDATVNFDWGVKKATKLTPAQNFFVRWEGTVTPQFSERYRFRIRADGGARLWINDTLIVDDWVTWKFPLYRSGTIELLAGLPATIKLEYFDTTGAASCSLRWSSPSQPVEVVPQAKLSTRPIMTRRDFLKVALWGAAACAAAPPTLRAQTHGGGHTPVLDFTGTPPYVPYRDPLPIPPTLKPKRRGRVDTYSISMRAGLAQCHSQLPPTPILGYNGSFPGPIIRATKGRQVEVTQVNQLPADHIMHSPTIHLHGALVAPEHDGHPNDGIAAGSSRTYLYPNQQRACPLWFHDHTHEATGERVYRGLAGLYFLDDPKDLGLRLPKGKYEIPLLIQDRSFLPTGELVYNTSDATLETGFRGDVILANGVIQPYLDVSARKYRFRILNGSNSRIYKLAVSSGQPLIQIGTDGGLLHRPQPKATIEIAPSERVDVVIDFTNLAVGTSVILQNKNDFGRLGAIMKFNVVKQEADPSLVPAFLSPWEDLPEAAAVTTRDFTLNRKTVGDSFRWVINGQTYDAANPPLATPKLGTLERWRFLNPTNHPHPMHLHLVQFQVVNIAGEPQDPSQHGWKDTVVVPPGSEVTVLARFEGYTGRYVFHCHNLEHEDFAMMAEFEVIP